MSGPGDEPRGGVKAAGREGGRGDVGRTGGDAGYGGGGPGRLPAIVLALLAAATTGAFFVVQHLKVTTPLLTGVSPPRPAVIYPFAGGRCVGAVARSSKFSFYLLHRADSVDVYIIDPDGTRVATLASGHRMARGLNISPGVFTWNGRENGGKVAPDGSYQIEVDLLHQGRRIVLSPNNGASPYTITVKAHAPSPVACGRAPAGPGAR